MSALLAVVVGWKLRAQDQNFTLSTESQAPLTPAPQQYSFFYGTQPNVFVSAVGTQQVTFLSWTCSEPKWSACQNAAINGSVPECSITEGAEKERAACTFMHGAQ